MKWFKHDSNAHGDSKLKRVRQKYGMVGYGLYWYCIELIAGNVSKEKITFQLEDDAEIIAIDWNLDQLKVEEMMRFFVEIGLFEQQANVITCLKLAKRLDDTNSKNPEIKRIINSLKPESEQEIKSETLRSTPSHSDLLGDAPNVSDQTRLDQIRLDKKDQKIGRFTPPSLEEISNHINEKNYCVDPLKFFSFYESKGWLVGKTKMKSWTAALAGWHARDKGNTQSSSNDQFTGCI